ncbi:hypothetical protein OG778_23845 [Streptomyces sp. NBC_00184]|uniref:hypothetical protein n=1 Tax=Streptomyces sp. NBC_00184 TaxID=2975673 RepID=UPI002E28FDF0|nr:hypothetical protein [Streptomyces sp. NBC_00184]
MSRLDNDTAAPIESATQNNDSDKGADMSGKNVVSVRGGKTHLRAQYLGDHVFPACRTGAMTNSGTKYRTTDAPVDCKTCSTYNAAHFETYYPSVEDEPTPDATTQEEDTMPAKTPEADAPNADVHALISDVHATIDQLKAVAPGLGAHDEAATLKQEAEDKIRQLPTGERNTLRKEVAAAFTAATKKPEPEPAPTPSTVTATAVQKRAEVEAEDPRKFDGVDKLIKDGVKAFSEGLALGLKLSNVGEKLARIHMEMRLSIPNPDANGLPDLTAIRKTTKNGAGAIYDEARKTIADDDVDRIAAHSSLVRATQNKASDVLVDWLDSFDTTPIEEVRVILDERFPGATDRLNENAELRAELNEDDPKRPAELSPSEAIRALYADHEIILPRYGRTELARIDRRVKALDAAKKELDALDGANPKKTEELKGKINDLKAEIPETFLEKTPEKTDAERAKEALEAVKAAMERAGKRAKKVKTAAQKNKVKTEAYALIRGFIDDLGLDVTALLPADDEE